MFLVSNQQWDVPETLLGRQGADEDHTVEMLLCFWSKAGASEFTNKFIFLRKFPHLP